MQFGASHSDTEPGATSGLSFACFSLDLEVGRRDSRISAFAGVRPDADQSLVDPKAGASFAAALAKLDDLADCTDFHLGHNLIAFDLPHLQAANPRLRLLRLPTVDTLRLNPLAFPRNSYHHLVKHYQDGGHAPTPHAAGAVSGTMPARSWPGGLQSTPRCVRRPCAGRASAAPDRPPSRRS